MRVLREEITMFWRKRSTQSLAISNHDGCWRVYADGDVIFTARRRGVLGERECRRWLAEREACLELSLAS